MRDPARIDQILALLKTYWEANPDLRLGQIMSNAAYSTIKRDDPFYMEDDKLEEHLTTKLNFDESSH